MGLYCLSTLVLYPSNVANGIRLLHVWTIPYSEHMFSMKYFIHHLEQYNVIVTQCSSRINSISGQYNVVVVVTP